MKVRALSVRGQQPFEMPSTDGEVALLRTPYPHLHR
jgi:hypothetical protein